MNKKISFFLIIILSSSFNMTVAQELVFKMSSGYTFPSSFSVEQGRARFGGNHAFTASVGFIPNEYKGAELFYSYQNSLLDVRSPLLNSGRFKEQVGIHYLMGGITGRTEVYDNFELTSSMRLGGVFFVPTEIDFRTISLFAAGLYGGFNYYFNERLGINGGINLLMPVFDMAGFVWWSSGSGVQVGVSSATPMLQFSLSGGITVRL